MPRDFTDSKSTLDQAMAWCRQAASHYLSQCWKMFLSSHGVNRPQCDQGNRTGTRAMPHYQNASEVIWMTRIFFAILDHNKTQQSTNCVHIYWDVLHVIFAIMGNTSYLFISRRSWTTTQRSVCNILVAVFLWHGMNEVTKTIRRAT